jgi:SlyX protein
MFAEGAPPNQSRGENVSEPELEKRMIELESKVAFQDDTIEQLNQVVIELRTQLEQTEKLVRVLQARLPEDEGIEIDPNEPPPPHY